MRQIEMGCRGGTPGWGLCPHTPICNPYSLNWYDFQKYHRVLNHAVWSSRQASRLLLQQLVKVFAGDGALVLGLDDTIEQRWGKRITARGLDRDPVRSSNSHFVKTSGLR